MLLHVVLSALLELAPLGLFVLGCVIINVFLSKTKMGRQFKTATPWMGWHQEISEKHTEFRIHPSNFIKVPSSR